MLDVLKKDEERTRQLNDDEVVSFGADSNLVNYEIKLKELDPKQFSIKNIRGDLYLVDTSEGD